MVTSVTPAVVREAEPDEQERRHKQSCAEYCGISRYFPCGVLTWLLCIPWAIFGAVMFHISPQTRPRTVDLFSRESCLDRNRADLARSRRPKIATKVAPTQNDNLGESKDPKSTRNNDSISKRAESSSKEMPEGWVNDASGKMGAPQHIEGDTTRASHGANDALPGRAEPEEIQPSLWKGSK